MDEIEQLRASYRPSRVRVLFVGESAPAGGAFFYKGHGMVHSEFRNAIAPHLPGERAFLDEFKEHGLYLDDLVLTPVNAMSRAERNANCEAHIPSLARRIGVYQPDAVVSFMLGIRHHIDAAIAASGITTPHHAVHFPGNGQQLKFRADMAKILPSIL